LPIILEISRGDKVEEYTLPQISVTIGRSAGNDIVLEDESVSRQHARLEWQEGVLYITDQGSTNGTQLNNLEITPYIQCPVKEGDSIAIGGFSALLRFSHETAPAPLEEKKRGPTWLPPVFLNRKALQAVVIVIVVCVAVGLTLLLSGDDSSPETPPPVQQPVPTQPAPAQPAQDSVTSAIAKVKPSVVRIEVDDGAGSGIIIDKSGHILTNRHVVEYVMSTTVILMSGEQYKGRVIARDKLSDLAIIRIDTSNIELSVATLGNSGELKSGEEIIAIGYPLGLEGDTTVSKGIFSAFRDIDKVQYIQTDAAVNPGSSGGPLINLQGEVIGIVTEKWVDEAVEGMGFAIAINEAQDFISEYIIK